MKNKKTRNFEKFEKNSAKLERVQLRKVYGGAQVTTAEGKTDVE